MRALGICVLALGLLAGTSAMAAGHANGSSAATSSPAPAEPAKSSSAAKAAPAPNPSPSPSPAEERISSELESLRNLVEAQSAQLQQQSRELDEQRQKTSALEQQLSALKGANAGVASSSAPSPEAAAMAAPAQPASAAGSSPAPAPKANASASGNAAAQDGAREINASYDNGFHLATADQKFTMNINGLFQPRFTAFVPNNDAQALGAPGATDNFDIFLGRLALSGSAFDPSVHYFVQFQGSTAGNTNQTNFIDWFAEKEFSPKLIVRMGRSWTPYSFENFGNPGTYLFADFSVAEYAFALSRSVGVTATGQDGKLGYALMVTNSVPGLDSGAQENFNQKVGFIGHVQYDILAPYGYREEDPDGASSPELTIWSSAAYNPVGSSSAFSNETAGDRTVGATTTIGFRDGWFTLQNTGFYRRTLSSFQPDFNSWGYAEQASYFIVPRRFEVDARIAGVLWGAPDFLPVSPADTVNTWYSGPNFPYHRIVEHSFGLNYYLHGNNAKLQTAYSYLTGNTFADRGFAASRVWIQAQVMF